MDLTVELGGDRYYDSGKGKRPPQDKADLLMVTAMKMTQSVDVVFRIK